MEQNWLEILKDFCDLSKKEFSEPWSFEEWTGAGNGKIAIRIQRIQEVQKEAPSFFKNFPFWLPPDGAEFQKLPSFEKPKLVPCPMCDGTGKCAECPECLGAGEHYFETDYNEYFFCCKYCNGAEYVLGTKIVCPSCSGTGKNEDSVMVPVKLGNFFVSNFLLHKISMLPDIEICITPTNVATDKKKFHPMFHFKFQGGVGAFMGLDSRFITKRFGGPV